MKKTDIRLTNNETSILRSFVGKKLIRIFHDEFTFTNTSTQAVAIEIHDKGIYYLYSFVEAMDYFGSTEDVAVLSLTNEKLPIISQKKFVDLPVEQKLCDIILVQENQRTFADSKQTYDVWLTRGIIFDFGENQIAFEKDIWFSEEIIVHRGYDLIEQFSPAENFGKDWDGKIHTECERKLESLK